MNNIIKDQVNKLTDYQEVLFSENKTEEALKVSQLIIELTQSEEDVVLLNEEAAAKYIGMPYTTFIEARKDGKIKFVKVGRSFKYRKITLEQYAEDEERVVEKQLQERDRFMKIS